LFLRVWWIPEEPASIAEKDLDDRYRYFIESDGKAEELVNHRFACQV